MGTVKFVVTFEDSTGSSSHVCWRKSLKSNYSNRQKHAFLDETRSFCTCIDKFGIQCKTIVCMDTLLDFAAVYLELNNRYISPWALRHHCEVGSHGSADELYCSRVTNIPSCDLLSSYLAGLTGWTDGVLRLIWAADRIRCRDCDSEGFISPTDGMKLTVSAGVCHVAGAWARPCMKHQCRDFRYRHVMFWDAIKLAVFWANFALKIVKGNREPYHGGRVFPWITFASMNGNMWTHYERGFFSVPARTTSPFPFRRAIYHAVCSTSCLKPVSNMGLWHLIRAPLWPMPGASVSEST